MTTAELEKPWYPPQQEGFGPWVEGPPPLGFKGRYQSLFMFERHNQSYRPSILRRGTLHHQSAVAHCLEVQS
jgi:hypothetical protein